jgi:hypothetical protein
MNTTSTVAQTIIRKAVADIIGKAARYSEYRPSLRMRRFKWSLGYGVSDTVLAETVQKVCEAVNRLAPRGMAVVKASDSTGSLGSVTRGIAVLVSDDCPVPAMLPVPGGQPAFVSSGKPIPIRHMDEHFSETVKLALAMQKVAMMFNVTMTAQEAVAYGRRLGPYNRLKNLGTIIAGINKLMPEGCPADYKIGNEFSPVVYVVVRGFDFYKLSADSKNRTAIVLDLTNKIEALAKADEFHVENCDHHKGLILRLWWD